MPNHIHLMVITSKPDRAKWSLSVELRAWTQRFHPGTAVWSPVPKGEKVPDKLQLKRQIRYVHLNPCRAKIVGDPFQWEWSTHRDVTGCVTEPWSDVQTLVECFGVSRARLGEAMHRYISGDPSVAVAGTPMIRAYREGAPIFASFAAGVSDVSQILLAVAVSLREKAVLKRGRLRQITVHVSNRLNLIPNPAKLSISQRHWNHLLTQSVDEQSIQVVLKILSDPRCR